MKLVRFLLLACICMMACRQQPQSNEVTNYDLPQMKDSGELVVLTLNSSTSYFNYRGEPMGFQYELAEQFARSLGVKLAGAFPYVQYSMCRVPGCYIQVPGQKAAAMPHPEKESPPVRKAIIFLLSDYSIVRLLLFREAF